jgi:hypothetical protein
MSSIAHAARLSRHQRSGRWFTRGIEGGVVRWDNGENPQASPLRKPARKIASPPMTAVSSEHQMRVIRRVHRRDRSEVDGKGCLVGGGVSLRAPASTVARSASALNLPGRFSIICCGWANLINWQGLQVIMSGVSPAARAAPIETYSPRSIVRPTGWPASRPAAS